MVLSKPNRAQAFDIVKCIRPDTITNGCDQRHCDGKLGLEALSHGPSGCDAGPVASVVLHVGTGHDDTHQHQFEKTRNIRTAIVQAEPVWHALSRRHAGRRSLRIGQEFGALGAHHHGRSRYERDRGRSVWILVWKTCAA